MKYLGIDYGTKRIGIAISDDTGTIAFPLTTLVTSKTPSQEIVELAEKHAAQTIVLGESRNYKGEPNPIMEDIDALKKDLESAGYTILFEPEFMTSAQASREVSEEHIDASAAALILQSYLDRNKKHPDIE